MFNITDSSRRAVKTKEVAINILNLQYLRAKKFLEDNWHNGNGEVEE
ncbi:hypothetical protein LCGC14_0371330 [marine sediment metagenome]|uniref:Uncharacterized protein n=1 Tax=marine sediment metagenome TaxID=412755 RepID=A0A0F9VS56_9ZZZZ